jgi:catechol 2,3-dioxygenase-like lactoylglutathione lyase family enzyme
MNMVLLHDDDEDSFHDAGPRRISQLRNKICLLGWMFLSFLLFLSVDTSSFLCDCFVIPPVITLTNLRQSTITTSSSSLFMSTTNSTTTLASSSLVSGTFHHSAIRTSNITLAMQFYSLFGFEPIVKFKAGPAKAAWLQQQNEQSSLSPRIELIEIPRSILHAEEEEEGVVGGSSTPTLKKRAPDLFQRIDLLGHNHIALDVTSSAQQLNCSTNLQSWMEYLNVKSLALFNKTMRVALAPKQIMVQNGIYEIAYIYDPDGALVELICQGVTLPQNVSSGWEPIDDLSTFTFNQ